MSEAEDFGYFANLIRDRSGIVLEASKRYLVDARTGPVIEEFKLRDFAGLVKALRSGGNLALQQRVVEVMTTNETSFFRDIHPFEALRTTVVPALLRSRAVERKLQIWSAACSSGQEPYTIAMLLRENFPELAKWTVSIVATDLSDQMLARARAGSFNQIEVNRGLPAALLAKYFKKVGVRWEIARELRESIDFRPLNLIEGWPSLPPADVVFMRNVLIYFDNDTKKKILARVRSVMNPGGYLFLGGAETTLNLDDNFKRLSVGKTGCYQVTGG